MLSTCYPNHHIYDTYLCCEWVVADASMYLRRAAKRGGECPLSVCTQKQPRSVLVPIVIRASLASRHKQATETIRFGPDGSRPT
jgi:hypothetical protein